MKSLGIMLLIAAAVLAVAGLLLILAGKIPFIGHLPGDFRIRGKGWSVWFPLTTCILLSILLTVLVNLLAAIFRK
jgi:hypothetical protein